MGDELTITIREKGQYETFSAYIEDIKKSVEKQNSNIVKEIMKKDSEIAELKAKVTSLEATNVSAEKSETETNIFNALNDTLFQLKEHDSKADRMVAKFDEFISRQNIIEEDMKKLDEKLSSLGNSNGATYDASKQEELEDIMKDIYAMVSDLKQKSVVPFRDKEEFVPSDDLSSSINQESNIEPPVDNIQESIPTPEETPSNVIPFANYQENVVPDVNAIDSIVPQENNEEQVNNEIDQDAQKVVATEEAPQTTLDQANTIKAKGPSGKATGSFKKRTKGPQIKDVSWPLNKLLEFPEEFKNYFKSGFVSNDLEVNVGKTR